MADTLIENMNGSNPYDIISVIVANASRLSDIPIVDGQLIFVQDVHTVAFDFLGKRVFYNQIHELSTDEDRKNLENPCPYGFYFVIDHATLWRYTDRWIKITTEPEDVVYIGENLPIVGNARSLYVNKRELNIAVWDESRQNYLVVSDTTEAIPDDTIDSFFIDKNSENLIKQ